MLHLTSTAIAAGLTVGKVEKQTGFRTDQIRGDRHRLRHLIGCLEEPCLNIIVSQALREERKLPSFSP
jgi:hypothetical protein